MPIYDIDDDARLLVAAREFSTMSGPIDALGFDANGNIYVIETKLFKNPDKRTVLAQAMDYGAALWKHHADARAFFDQLDEYAQKQFGQMFAEKFCDFFGLEDASDALKNITTNLEDGSIKFVILMDKLEGRLKDLIAYINQNSKFDVYAVEIDFYKYDEFEIIIPKLYGAEVRKEVATKTSSGQRGKWNDETFRAKVTELPDDQRRAVLAIYEWAQHSFDTLKFGTGVANGSVGGILPAVTKTASFFSLYTDGTLGLKYWWAGSNPERGHSQYLYKLMRQLDDGRYSKNDALNGTEYIPTEFVVGNYEAIIAAFDQFIATYKEEQ
ncbi:MAG: hypothetical protein Q4B06_03440 [Candidatus Saccharibacteria bacterium]|nr:hypothetical protein [Candidatus Saccharibacteria bacterium]